MLKTELLEIITNGENSGVEFKRDDIRPEQLAKEIVALVNFQGGRILLGVEDNGAISGLQRPDTEEWVMNVEKMIAGLRYSRNTVLMETMRDYGYVDYRGMGIRSKVLPLLKAHKHPEPAFEANEDHLKTTLYRKRAP